MIQATQATNTSARRRLSRRSLIKSAAAMAALSGAAVAALSATSQDDPVSAMVAKRVACLARFDVTTTDEAGGVLCSQMNEIDRRLAFTKPSSPIGFSHMLAQVGHELEEHHLQGSDDAGAVFLRGALGHLRELFPPCPADVQAILDSHLTDWRKRQGCRDRRPL